MTEPSNINNCFFLHLFKLDEIVQGQDFHKTRFDEPSAWSVAL